MRDQVVLISGGSRGLGQGLVQAVLEQGGIAATFSRRSTPFLEAEQRRDPAGNRFLWAPIDGADFAAAARFAMQVAKRYGRVDALINNAATLTTQLLPLTRAEEIHKMVALNLELAIHLAQTCAKIMLTQRAGAIVNISSLNAVRGHAGVAVYSATKAALDGLTRALARELGPAGIRVNSIAPGYFESELSAAIGPREKERIVRRTPLGRLGEIADMVGVLRFLLSAEARFITGQTIVVDGGITC